MTMRAQTRMRGPTRAAVRSVVDYSLLHGYQRAGVDFIRQSLEEHGSCLLADSMGLGKTVQTLRAFPRRARVILVSPASVLSEWEAETEKWRSDLRVDVDSGLRLPAPGEIVAVSYDSLPDPVRAPGGRLRMLLEPTDDVILVLDECQYAKNGKALRTQRVRWLRQQCGRCLGLSATPMEGYPEDLWGVLVTLGLAARVFPGGWEELVTMYGGSQRYIIDRRTRTRRAAGYRWGLVDPEVNVRLREVMMRRETTDPEIEIQLPAVRRYDVKVAVPPDLKAMLDAEHARVWDEVEAERADSGKKNSGLPPFEVLSAAREALARSRVPAALDWVRNADPKVPLLVFSAHLEPLEAIADMKLPDGRKIGVLTGAVTKGGRSSVVKDFQDGKIDVLAMSIQAGGVGLNLQRAGAVMFVDREYTPAKNAQAEARAARQGNKRKRVLVYRLVSNHPLDLRLNEILDEKERLFRETMGIAA